MIANASFGRSQRDVVLHAKAGEDLDFAVVHLHRTRDRDLSLRMGENFPDSWLEIENSGGAIELLQHGVEDRSVRCHSGSLDRKGLDGTLACGGEPSQTADIMVLWSELRRARSGGVSSLRSARH